MWPPVGSGGGATSRLPGSQRLKVPVSRPAATAARARDEEAAGARTAPPRAGGEEAHRGDGAPPQRGGGAPEGRGGEEEG